MPRHLSLSLSDAQKYFLQVMMNKKVIDQNNFKPVFNGVLKKFNIDCSDTEYKEYYINFLREINDVIRTFSMEIKTATCEITALSFFCLIRQYDTGLAGTLSALYSSTELRVFRKILELVLESDEGCVEYGTAAAEVVEVFEAVAHEAATQDQNQTAKIPSSAEIRVIVEKFIQDYWLMEVVTKPNMITLHGRALAELSQWMKEAYKDDGILKYCYICKNLLLSGVSCENCEHKLHLACARNMLKRSAKECPNCRASYSEDKIEEVARSIATARSAINSLGTQVQ